MANKMPPELLEKFKKSREEKSGSSNEDQKKDKRKSALSKARKAKEMSSKK